MIINPKATDTISGDELGVMTTFGHIEKFDPTNCISTYLEHVEILFAVNDIKDEKQVAVFLSVIGPNNYALLCDLLIPKKPHEKSLAALFETLLKYFKLNFVIIAECFHFHQ